jgi:hypothetical protein
VEAALLREQLMARPPGTRLVFPTPEGRQWDRARFRDRVLVKSAAAAARRDREEIGHAESVFEGPEAWPSILARASSRQAFPNDLA